MNNKQLGTWTLVVFAIYLVFYIGDSEAVITGLAACVWLGFTVWSSFRLINIGKRETMKALAREIQAELDAEHSKK